MRRRSVTRLLGAAVAFWPLAARAQQPDRVRRIGVLMPYIESDAQAQARVTALRAALQERGWAYGRNIAFESLYAEGQLDRLPALATDLVRTKVDVILMAGTESTDAARKATSNIPIVMVAVGDPIAAGFIASLAQPGGERHRSEPSCDRVDCKTTGAAQRNFSRPDPAVGSVECKQCKRGPEIQTNRGGGSGVRCSTPNS